MTKTQASCSRAVLAVVLAGATFAVTNTADSGAGSLRQAIMDANGTAGADTHAFIVNKLVPAD